MIKSDGDVVIGGRSARSESRPYCLFTSVAAVITIIKIAISDHSDKFLEVSMVYSLDYALDNIDDIFMSRLM